MGRSPILNPLPEANTVVLTDSSHTFQTLGPHTHTHTHTLTHTHIHTNTHTHTHTNSHTHTLTHTLTHSHTNTHTHTLTLTHTHFAPFLTHLTTSVSHSGETLSAPANQRGGVSPVCYCTHSHTQVSPTWNRASKQLHSEWCSNQSFPSRNFLC